MHTAACDGSMRGGLPQREVHAHAHTHHMVAASKVPLSPTIPWASADRSYACEWPHSTRSTPAASRSGTAASRMLISST